MSLLLDDRGHNPPLMPYFAPFDVLVESVLLDSADIMFAGNGPDGTCSIAIERKRIGDLINSMRDRRLIGAQLEGLLEYDYPMLLVEGVWRPNSQTGVLEVLRQGFVPYRIGNTPLMYSEVDNFLNSLRFICKLIVLRTGYPEETARCVVDMYHWWEKPWEKHKAHKDIYAPVPEKNGGRKAGMIRRTPSLAVKVAAQLPGVDQKAWTVAEYFGNSVERMLESDAEDWGKALGIKDKKSKTVKQIMESLR